MPHKDMAKNGKKFDLTSTHKQILDHFQLSKQKYGQEVSTEFWDNYLEISLQSLVNTTVINWEIDDITQLIYHRYQKFMSHWKTNGYCHVTKPQEQDIKLLNNLVSIEIVVNDRPFVVDSLFNLLEEYGLLIQEIIHPIIGVIVVDDKWYQLETAKPENQYKFSHVYCLCNPNSNIDWDKFYADLQKLLQHVIYATDDFGRIKSKCELLTQKQISSEVETKETILESEQKALFRWYLQGNLIFFGYCEIAESNIGEEELDLQNKLGIIQYVYDKDDQLTIRNIINNIRYFKQSNLKNSLVEINYITHVHKIQNVALAMHKVHDENYRSKVIVIACIFSNKSNHEYILNIPVIRLKLNGVLDGLKLLEGSHSYKTAVEYYGSFPKLEFFRIERDEISYLFEAVRYVWYIDQIHIKHYIKLENNYIRIVVLQPVQRMSTDASIKIEKILNQRLGKAANYNYSLQLKQIIYHHFIWFLKSREDIEKINIKELEQELRQELKSWEDKTLELVNKKELDADTKFIQNIIHNGFPKTYKYSTTASVAIDDIKQIHRLLQQKTNIIKISYLEPTIAKLNIYTFNKINLREIFLKFDCFGLDPIKSSSFDIKLDQQLYLQSFHIQHEAINQNNFDDFNKRFCLALQLLLEEKIEKDPLLTLITSSNLSYGQIRILQTYRNYLILVVPNYNQLNINQTLLANPDFAVNLVNYFESKFQYTEKNHHSDEQHLQNHLSLLHANISNTSTLLEESIFNALVDIMQATVRTSYYINKSSLVIKIDCRRTKTISNPKPAFEIYQYNDWMEGVHLRAGLISRGGIRISDRREDYRTEILGLMRTQVLKNAVIIPDGAKGGFIVKKEFKDQQQANIQLPKYYKSYIHNMLQITDNILDNKSHYPKDLVVYDDHDPYFVVAADKGTATYSDYANEISLENKFWLGDAFASGGSTGYNHKELGITAKGAFECLKVHFKELGMNFDTDSFSAVGIGDMSGDVFGNGLLISPRTRLVGAFNHKHIFIDPTPNEAESWTERKRLFEIPYSSWLDYDKSKISAGGGVFLRNQKSIPLSKEMKELFSTTKSFVSGVELIKMLLTLKVDVIFNGGIGTYIKSKNESNSEVGDKANESVRVNADKIQAKIICEGGNLGITQQGRIDFSLLGGLINNDAIDNSAGVDLSDHEVNLKILTDLMVMKKIINNFEQRQQLFTKIADDVVKLCLDDNKIQSYRLSIDQRRSVEESGFFISEIEHYEHVLELNRFENSIPDNQWFIDNYNNNITIPRPILSVLLSYSKNYAYRIILEHSISDQQRFNSYYLAYFPKKLYESYDISGIEHPLKRQIIASMIANKFVNRCGIIFLNAVHQITARKSIDIIRAYLIVSELQQDDDLRDMLLNNSLADKFDKACFYVKQLEELTKSRTIWFLANFDNENLSYNLIDQFNEIFTQLKSLESPQKYNIDQNRLEEMAADFKELGYDKQVVEKYIDTVALNNPLETALLKMDSNMDFDQIRNIVNKVEELFNFNQISSMLFDIIGHDHWEKSFIGNQIIRANKIKRKLFNLLIKDSKNNNTTPNIEEFINQNKNSIQAYNLSWKDFNASSSNKILGISVLLDELQKIAEGN